LKVTEIQKPTMGMVPKMSTERAVQERAADKNIEVTVGRTKDSQQKASVSGTFTPPMQPT
jgi:hypothetical protein